MGVPRTGIEAPRPEPGPADVHGRRVRYLRLAVTDRCNLRCRYCLPAAGIPLLPPDRLLQIDELVRIGRTAAALGLAKIRLTGGEPTCRPDLVDLVGRLADLPGVDLLAMTTNGQELARLAEPLQQAGLARVNVSLDSLRPGRYKAITRGGELDRCLAGVAAARAAGLDVKLNVVVMRGVNDDEIADFVALAATGPLAVRFIEFMPTGCRPSRSDLFTPVEKLLAEAIAGRALCEVAPAGTAGPAREFRLAGSAGRVGVITARSRAFCASCNRLRITAAGRVCGCLFDDRGEDLRPHLAAGREAALTQALAQAIRAKPRVRRLPRSPQHRSPVFMSRMGG